MGPACLTSKRIEAVLDGAPKRLPRHRAGQEFLRGPIPLSWLRAATVLPGKALAVGLVLWFKAGITKRGEVKMTTKLLHKFGLSRYAGYRGLVALEDAGLVTAVRRRGRCPRVTILRGEQEVRLTQSGRRE